MIRSTLLACTLLAALPARHAAAKPYKFTDIKFETHHSDMTDINANGMMVGGYFRLIDDVHNCFTYDSKTGAKAAVSDPLGARGTECWGINDAGTIVGDYIDSVGVHRAYIDAGGTFTTIDPPGSLSAIAYAVSNSGVVGGTYVDIKGVGHGFLYDGTTYTTVDVPGSLETEVWGVNSSGAYTVEATVNGFPQLSYLVSGSTMTPIAFPKAKDGTAAHHLNDAGLVATTWIDKSDDQHGGVYNSVTNTYYDITVPNSTLTITDGINTKMEIAGRYSRSSPRASIGYLGQGKLMPQK